MQPFGRHHAVLLVRVTSGPEPVPLTVNDGNALGKSGFRGGAESGALSGENAQNGGLADPQLAHVVAAWDGLSADAKERIVGIVDEAAVPIP